MIKFIYSVELASLLDKLNSSIRNNKQVFRKDLILVRNYAVKRYIETELVKANGIISNIDVLLPLDGIEEIINEIKPDNANDSWQLDRNKLKWLIYREFTQNYNFPDPLTNNSSDEYYRYAKEYADVFWDYIAFIPEKVIEWLNPKPDLFSKSNKQELLFSNIFAKIDISRIFPIESLKKHEKDLKNILGQSFNSITIFDIPFLIPLHTKFFEHLSKYIDIEFYLTMPSEYSFELYKAAYQSGEKHSSMNEDYNPFLNRNSEYFYEFINSLNTKAYSISKVDANQFERDTQLNVIQKSISKNDISILKQIHDYDYSVQIHCCHTRTREMEVLRQNVLSCLNEIPDLKVSDILILFPDLEGYIPAINAVFNIDDGQKIPFEIGGVRISKRNDIFACLESILNVRNNRFKVSHILSILENKQVLEKFGFTENDLDFISQALRETAVRWGIDSAQRQEYDIELFDGFSWDDGLDRLFMGFATYSENSTDSIHDIFPYGNIPLSNIKAIGNLKVFIKRLNEVTQGVQVKRTPSEWADYLLELMEIFFEFPKDLDIARFQYELIQKVVLNFKSLCIELAIEGKIELSVIISDLKESIEKKTRNFNFQSGKLTFANFVNMSNLPYRVIFIAGMNHGEFPQKDIWSSLSELQKYDIFKKSKRNEDKYHFMRTILSAQDRIYFSYIGKDIHDNHELPPATSLHEIEEFLIKMYPQKEYFFEHYIHGFNESYFNGKSKLKSNSEYDYLLLEKRIAGENNNYIFDSNINKEPKYDIIELENLFLFYKDPVKYFVKNVCGINLDIYINEIEDNEPVQLNALDNYKLRKQIIDNFTENHVSLKKSLRASGFIQAGNLGDLTYDIHKLEVEELEEVFLQMTDGYNESHEKIELNIENSIIQGEITGIYGRKICELIPSSIKDKYIFLLFIKIIILSAQTGENCSGEIAFKEGKTARIEIPDEFSIENYLIKLIYYYKLGHKRCLRLFTEYFSDYWSKRNPEFTAEKAQYILSKIHSGDHEGRKEEYYYYAFNGLDYFPDKELQFVSEMQKVTEDLLKPFFLARYK